MDVNLQTKNIFKSVTHIHNTHVTEEPIKWQVNLDEVTPGGRSLTTLTL